VEVGVPSLEHLREQAVVLGVAPTDDDLRAVLGFLEVILPALTEVEELLSPGDVPGADP
jgi:hypothetical protein